MIEARAQLGIALAGRYPQVQQVNADVLSLTSGLANAICTGAAADGGMARGGTATGAGGGAAGACAVSRSTTARISVAARARPP